jgi:gliding motility-associated-like protein
MLTPQFSQTYLITARDSNGCTASAPLQLLVRRDRPVGVPTAFSPNGDGNNDVIFIFAQEGVLREINYFRIFDRWGEEVFFEENFQPNDPAFGWDGMLDGEFMNPAVFVFVAEVVFDDGTTEVIDGDFSLVK